MSSAGLEDLSGHVPLLRGCCEAYRQLVGEEAELTTYSTTFHLRHFLYFVRHLRRLSGPSLARLSPIHVATALGRNFGGVSKHEFEAKVGKVFFECIHREVEDAQEATHYSSFPPPGWDYDVAELAHASILGLTQLEINNSSFDPNIEAPRNVMLVVDPDSLALFDAAFPPPCPYSHITVSAFAGDDDSVGREKAISRVAAAMSKGTTVRLYNGERGRTFSAFYDAFNMRFLQTNAAWYVAVTVGARVQHRPYNPHFRAVVVVTSEEYDRMRARKSTMLPLLSRFEAFVLTPEELLKSRTLVSR